MIKEYKKLYFYLPTFTSVIAIFLKINYSQWLTEYIKRTYEDLGLISIWGFFFYSLTFLVIILIFSIYIWQVINKEKNRLRIISLVIDNCLRDKQEDLSEY